jgi:uncharacterized membrane protein YheB (UPF0754 family)
MKFDLLDILKKNFLTILLAIGGFVWVYIQEGVKNDLNDLIDQRIEEKVSDSELVKTILKSDQVKEFTEEAGQEIRNKIIEDVTSKDSNKINQNAYLGKELGIRDEAVTPLLRDMLHDYKEGKLVKQEDIRPRRNPNTIEL